MTREVYKIGLSTADKHSGERMLIGFYCYTLMNSHFSCWLILLTLIVGRYPAIGQLSGRITGDMVTKEKTPDGHYTLNVGKFFYDSRVKQVIYQMRFPRIETVVSQDTAVYSFRNQQLYSKVQSFTLPESTIFHLALVSRIKDFGLKSPQYTIEKIEREGNQVYVTYKPNVALPAFGKVKLSQKNNRLEGIIFFDPKGQPIAKQLFRQYTTVSGLEFPQEVIMTATRNGKPYYQITNYKNIEVNDFKDATHYYYPLPK